MLWWCSNQNSALCKRATHHQRQFVSYPPSLRNDSKRIDNQLRGRCGRQGDPGRSRFFLSIDDTLFRKFGGDNIQNVMQNQFIDDSPLESNLLTKSVDLAQKRVEEQRKIQEFLKQKAEKEDAIFKEEIPVSN